MVTSIYASEALSVYVIPYKRLAAFLSAIRCIVRGVEAFLLQRTVLRISNQIGMKLRRSGYGAEVSAPQLPSLISSSRLWVEPPQVAGENAHLDDGDLIAVRPTLENWPVARNSRGITRSDVSWYASRGKMEST